MTCLRERARRENSSRLFRPTVVSDCPEGKAHQLGVGATAEALDRPLAKVARPLMAVALVAPCNVLVPALRVALTTVLVSELTRLPKASSIRTTGAGENAAAAVAEAGGWVRRVR